MSHYHVGSSEDNELIPGLMLPPAIHGRLRQLLAQIESTASIEECQCTGCRAEGMVEGLELGNAVDTALTERLYRLIKHTTNTRLQQLKDLR